MSDSPSAEDTGAQFEENDRPQKVLVNSRPRVAKPESSGDVEASELNPDKTGTPAKLPSTKPTKLQPDISKEEAESAAPQEKPSSPRTEVIDQNVQGLIASKKYFVPVGQVTKRRNIQVLIFGTVLIVVVAAGIFVVMIT